MTNIAIYGVGLIGGSLALCFKDKPGLRVIGHSPNPASVAKYLQRNVVDAATTSFEEAARDADVIFVCVPVGLLADYLRRLSDLPLKPGCIVTDVGSTKSSVVAAARALPWKNGACFIGGHPMAGSERSGVEAASAFLFENAYYVLTPTADTPPEAYERLRDLLTHTRAQIVRMDPDEHDEVVGAVSHLPHIIAVALVNQVAGYGEANEMYARLAAGGFRDITRIASSEPAVWRDILINNRHVMLKLMRDWQEQFDRFVEMLQRADGEGIMRAFASAGAFRNALPERRKGVITPMYDVYVDIPDRPGVIGHIATLLGDRGINLSNIQIYESRLDVPGVLRLSFRSRDAQEQAFAVLREANYSVCL
jgi:prephenate dehydrogenase